MKTCLVVDDSSVIRKVARRILEGLESEIVEAEDGEQALDICRRKMPDAILLDWNMPKMDDYEFLRSLRKLPGGDGLSLGAADYIPKPESNREVTGSTSFRRELIEKIRHLGLRAKRLRAAPAARHEAPPLAAERAAGACGPRGDACGRCR